jgi:hypothetical protein
MKHTIRALALLLMIAGCGGGGGGKVTNPPPPDPTPVPNTPTNAVRLFEWAQEHRDTVLYRKVLTQDFKFSFAAGDPAGLAFGDTLDRAKELIIATHMFVGGSPKPAATSINLVFDPVLTAQPDDRGFDPTTHKLIHTSHSITVRAPGDTLTAAGFTDFYVVRGDVAAIPPGLGLSADANRWWIEGWVDKSIVSGPALAPRTLRPTGANEAHSDSWGKIKSLYY